MPKVTVRERAIPAEQPKPYVYDGPFSATRGGTIAEGEGKSARWRVGVMPALDLTLTDSGLRRRPEPRLNVEMLKVEF